MLCPLSYRTTIMLPSLRCDAKTSVRTGLEPAATRLSAEVTDSCNAASSAPDRARTCDHPLNGRVLYQLSYQSMAPAFPGSHLFLRSDRVAYSDQPIGCRKHELPYSCAPFRNEHDNGLEPIIPVWKTGVLPITPIVRLVEVTGVEPVSKLRQILRMLTR